MAWAAAFWPHDWTINSTDPADPKWTNLNTKVWTEETTVVPSPMTYHIAGQSGLPGQA